MKYITTRRAVISLCGINFFVYGLNAVYNCFIPLYLGRYYDEVAVGGLLSIGPVVMMFAPLIWGRVSDRAKSKNNVLAFIIACAAVVFCAVGLIHSFAYTALMLALFMFFSAPYGGLLDTVTLEASRSSSLKYGPLRLMGTVGYGVIAVITGLLPASNEALLFGVYAVTAAISILMLRLAPQIEGHASKREKVSILPLVRDRSMLLLLIVIFTLMFAFSYYSNFMPAYMTETLGLPAWVWGVNVFATLAVEFPFFILFDKIMEKFGLRRLLFVTVLISALRYFLLAAVTSPFAILTVGIVTGAWITVSIYCGTYYINATVADNIRASGQSYMYAVGYGAPKVIAGLGGGFITKYLGVPIGYLICAAACTLCIAAALAFPKNAFK